MQGISGRPLRSSIVIENCPLISVAKENDGSYSTPKSVTDRISEAKSRHLLANITNVAENNQASPDLGK